MKSWLYEHSLSLVLFGLFFIFLFGLSVAGLSYENQELGEHDESAITYVEYISSGGFIEAVFENWESEFLQMGALVVFTIWFRQKGSADSKKLRGKGDVDTEPRYSLLHAASWGNRKKALGEIMYANSLSIALFTLFALSFFLHALSGTAAANEEAVLHGAEQLSVVQYVGSSQFWFESFQNWQSEFLAVGMLLVLSVYLRQRKSPESKPIGESNAKTGS
jgi:hypothetical protein